MELTDNPGNMSALTLEANVHVVDQGTSDTKGLETKKKEEKKPEQSTLIKWKHNVFPHSRENCLPEGGTAYQFEKSSSAFDIYKQIINLDILIEILVQQSNLYLQ